MNCLKYHEYSKTKHFEENIFEKGVIPIINCPTQISEHLARLSDKILTTVISNNTLKKGIIKLNVSEHFAIFFSIQLTKEKLRQDVIKIKKEF